MKLLPIEHITYRTKLREEEVFKRLSDLVEPGMMFRTISFRGSSTKLYEGVIDGRRFQISRIKEHRNSNLVIKGIIEKGYDGLSIKIEMRLNIFIMVFMFLVCGTLGLICISLLRQSFPPQNLGPFGLLLFIYVLTIGGFNSESNKSKKDLQRVFEADLIES